MSSAELTSDSISAETFSRLHPEAIADPRKIANLVHNWSRAKISLRRGTNRAVAPELATIVEVNGDKAAIDCVDFGAIGSILFLSTEYRGIPYFCSLSVETVGKQVNGRRRIVVLIPSVIYKAERRDRMRNSMADQARSVAIVRESGERCEARVVDVSGDGMGVSIPPAEHISLGESFRIEDGDGSSSWGIARNEKADLAAPGWRRIGLSILPETPGTNLVSVSASTVLDDIGGLAESSNPELLSKEPTIVRFLDPQGEELVGILDQTGDSNGAPAVLIPSAWGKTKETLSGLAAMILATFSELGRPVSVLRFDGIRKRGESHNDPECQAPILQNLNYTFTQGATDLLAAARYLQEERAAGPVVVVSLSVASVEARRAIVLDEGKRFVGWISVVGATDPQSLIRVISGGVDYLAGAEQGLRFGRQNVQGLLLDIDRTAADALASRIAFLDDARRDFTAIQCPVTWISGTNDAWTDPLRIEDALAFGPREQRRLIVSDTGHQLKNSRDAEKTFGIVASECARMLGVPDPAQPVSANSRSLRKRQQAERRRLSSPLVQTDLRSFWRDYLLGRDLSLGMELVTETSSYRSLMRDQLAELVLAEGQTVVDLGSGVATFERALHHYDLDLSSLRVVAVDFVVEGVRRGRAAIGASSPLPVGHVVADLGLSSAQSFPLSPKSADRVLGSLLLNYLPHPEQFLSAAYALLRPGGRIVLSVLRKDADTSKICVSGVAELRTGQGLASFGQSRAGRIDGALGGFINDAARLLDLEEQGIFRFWDRDELRTQLARAGFSEIVVRETFGTPPQAWLVSANRAEQAD